VGGWWGLFCRIMTQGIAFGNG